MRKLICYIILFSVFLVNIHISQAQNNALRNTTRDGNEIGDKAPEIILSRYDGKPVVLSSLQGHIVLLYFWKSNDTSLKYHFPKIKDAYNRLQKQVENVAKGFEIFSISLDYRIDKWISAIHRNDANIGYHVIDLQGLKSINSKLYGVDRTPLYFLLDPNGMIWAKSYSMKSIMKEIRSLILQLESDKYESDKYDANTISELEKSTNETDLNYDTQSQNLLRGGGDPLKGLNISRAAKQMEIGNYFALIIGIDNYKGAWLPLKNAVKDAEAVENLLKTKYKIDHFRTLHNNFATRKNIIQELQWLVDNVTENDNVFIYYSGHGEFKEDLHKGYWVPVEAQTSATYELISNSNIQIYLSGIKSKHTLLVSDACFSGDILRGGTVSVPFEQTSKYYTKVHTLRSRQAFTSGGVEPVMDGGREGHSVFTYYLLEMLKRNESKYYDAGQLYNDMKIPVTNNSDQTPLLQPIKNTGDEGGQFIFIKK